MNFEMNGKKLSLMANGKKKKKRVLVKLFNKKGKVLKKKTFKIKKLYPCHHCGEDMLAGSEICVRVNNYLPDDKIVLLKLSSICPSGVRSEINLSFKFPISH